MTHLSSQTFIKLKYVFQQWTKNKFEFYCWVISCIVIKRLHTDLQTVYGGT